MEEYQQLGIQVASGEWVAFIDADDEIENDMFKAYEDAIFRHPEVDIVLTGYMTVDWDGRIGASHGPINTAVWKRGGIPNCLIRSNRN